MDLHPYDNEHHDTTRHDKYEFKSAFTKSFILNICPFFEKKLISYFPHYDQVYILFYFLRCC
jgi:hypothetical protein